MNLLVDLIGKISKVLIIEWNKSLLWFYFFACAHRGSNFCKQLQSNDQNRFILSRWHNSNGSLSSQRVFITFWTLLSLYKAIVVI